MSLSSLFSGGKEQHKRIEFVRMRGPQGKGHAEMAIERVKGTGTETPAQTPDREGQADDLTAVSADYVINVSHCLYIVTDVYTAQKMCSCLGNNFSV
jgi:hypothetical protein